MDSEMMNTPGLREEDRKAKEKKEITVAEAVAVLSAELKKDNSPGSYYYSWQSNIACAIMDSFMDTPNPVDVPKWANDAAKRFLDNLIS